MNDASFAPPTTCPACILLAETTPECVVSGHAIAAHETDRAPARPEGWEALVEHSVAPDPQRDFADALAKAERKASELRDAICLVVDRAGNLVDDDAVWKSTMTDAAIVANLGATMMLCDGNGVWIHRLVESTGGAIAGALPALIDDFSIALADGMTRIAISCVCSACPFCELRSRVPAAEADRQIAEEMRKMVGVKRQKSRLVGRNGRPLQ